MMTTAVYESRRRVAKTISGALHESGGFSRKAAKAQSAAALLMVIVAALRLGVRNLSGK
jgi:hypothetical protein